MIKPSDLYNLTEDQLLEKMGEAQVESLISHAIRLELQRRALRATVAASEAQITAANAAKDTAVWTKRSAIAIAASVIIMAIGVYLN
ncbi:hypothetical protein [Afipia carboxidovorans]|uniref:hypothetical protein n=1 Tax=Afipia carboxidovorans TaxID=40137 RepID=UPI0030917D8F|nr:hypothetical protein CRBSH125_22020 [Afipia carboxidovorans]